MRLLKLLILPIFAFSYELEFSKKFEHDLPKDTLSTNIKISIKDKTEIKVGERLDIFNQKIKSYDKVERKFDDLTIKPRYRHALNTPKVRGYIGELKYMINSRKARYMNEFILEMTKLKRNRDTVVSISNLAWSVKKDSYNVIFDLLRLEAITWVTNYSKNLSKDLGKECSIKSIKIDKQQQLMKLKAEKVYSSETAVTKSIPIPQSSLEKIIIFADYTLECK